MRTTLLRPALAVVLATAVVAGCTQSSSSSAASGLAPVGANHATHLQGGVFSSGMSCSNCHAPVGFTVDFSQNPFVQAGGATFDPVAKTCSNVACHGNFTFNAVSGARATPLWNDPTPLTCTSCHGMPPTGHMPIGAATDARSCAACHADSVNGDGTINVATGAHMNGLAEAATGSCAACHGDPSRVPGVAGTDIYLTSAPPMSPTGAPTFAEGAHLKHVNPNPAVQVSAPVACSECHVVPADATHATVPPAQKVVFGTLAKSGGAVPTWTAGTAGCAASYCHGNFTFNTVAGSKAAPLWTDVTPVTCTSCHGMPPTGHPPVTGTTAPTCNACHPTAVDRTGAIITGGAHLNGVADIAALGCTECHGDKARVVGTLPGTDINLPSSPPIASAKNSPNAIGAHIAHVNPALASSASAPVKCSECHVVPLDFAHAARPPAQSVVFGALSKTGGAAPTWAAGTAGCAASYCHGNFNFNGVSGANATPVWTSTAGATCTSCHGMPPTGHVPVATPVSAASCSGCHPKSINPDGSINRVDKGHLNGLPDTSALGCASCHGDITRKGTLAGTDLNLASAPPIASPGASANAVGAHLGHVNPTASSFLMAPIACAECHVVPVDSTHAKSPPAQRVVFGAFSKTGGATPSWVAGTAGCAASYCHGSFTFNGVTGAKATPIWTDATAITCSSCHGMPPTGHFAIPAPVTASSCAPCHPAAVNADGSINAVAKGHLNGLPDVTTLACTTCHGDAARKGTLTGTDANLASAPPVAQTGAPSYAVGAHMGHMNPTAASYLMAPIACAECHTVPADAKHATSPPATVVVFGALSKTGGAAPSFVAGTAGCAASYCHGTFTLGTVTGTASVPIWTSTTPLACTACHGMPPTGHPTYTGLPTAASCFQCHPQSVNADGTIKAGGGHINGKADGGGCTGCHGDPPTTGKHTISDHRNLRCDKCHPTGYTSTSAVATFHRNNVVDINATAGYSCGLKGCATGTRGTCANSCHKTESW
jgi:predicted CxxxxCH...CXXCH cytochrome family protein